MITDLINILEDRYSPVEIVEMLNEIDVEDIEKYAKAHDVCPKCLGELILHTYKERRPDHFGFPAYETMRELVCCNCGEIY